MERDLMKYFLRGADWDSLFLNCFAFECSWYVFQKCLESGRFGGFRIDLYGKLVCLFVVHSSRFVNVFVITILYRAGGLFGCVDTRILICRYWCRIVSSMNMKQVGLLGNCTRCLVYLRVWGGLAVYVVWVTSQCWRVLYVHPCIVVEKKD